MLPDRALPLPFCGWGFLPPPLTSLRVFVLWVPCRHSSQSIEMSLLYDSASTGQQYLTKGGECFGDIMCHMCSHRVVL